jgi:hypothetical protein
MDFTAPSFSLGFDLDGDEPTAPVGTERREQPRGYAAPDAPSFSLGIDFDDDVDEEPRLPAGGRREEQALGFHDDDDDDAEEEPRNPRAAVARREERARPRGGPRRLTRRHSPWASTTTTVKSSSPASVTGRRGSGWRPKLPLRQALKMRTTTLSSMLASSRLRGPIDSSGYGRALRQLRRCGAVSCPTTSSLLTASIRSNRGHRQRLVPPRRSVLKMPSAK